MPACLSVVPRRFRALPRLIKYQRKSKRGVPRLGRRSVPPRGTAIGIPVKPLVLLRRLEKLSSFFKSGISSARLAAFEKISEEIKDTVSSPIRVSEWREVPSAKREAVGANAALRPHRLTRLRRVIHLPPFASQMGEEKFAANSLFNRELPPALGTRREFPFFNDFKEIADAYPAGYLRQIPC